MTLEHQNIPGPAVGLGRTDGNIYLADENTPRLGPDSAVLPRVTEYLNRGLALRRWWAEIEKKGGPKSTFQIERSFYRATRSFGFFDEATVDGKAMPILGIVQEMFYDQMRPPSGQKQSRDLAQAELREFTMKYLMRTTSFRQPEAYSDASSPVAPPALKLLSWCPRPSPSRLGFGFSQLFNKPSASNFIRAFPSYEQHAIVDQRLIGPHYEWIVLRVRIFDFDFKFRPFGERGPELVFSENEESYLVVHEELVTHRDYSDSSPPPVAGPTAIGEFGMGSFRPIGDYGIGYTFVKNPIQSIFGFGPGAFDAAIQLINFRIYDTGYISVRMVFIANRLHQISNIVLDPIHFGFGIADMFSMGLASRLFSPLMNFFSPNLRVNVDPVSAYIEMANLISGGSAARNLCISRETVERLSLLIHFQQHYQTILGTLSTWRQFDWLHPESLPPWVISGVSS